MFHDLADDLRAEIAKGHVLVVVGSGVSLGATQGNPLASWQGLLENGVERCVAVRGLDAKWANRVREEIRSGDLDDLLSAAEKVSSKLGFPDGEYGPWLRSTVGQLELKDRSVVEAVRDLGLPIATTNYDSLLETATGHPTVTWKAGDKAVRVVRGEEPGILHLHGHWEEPASVVLGVRSYEQIRGNLYAQAVLRAIQTLHTLLFIGCGDGLNDPNFGAIISWAREAFRSAGARHYRLCKENELASLREKHKEDRLSPVSYGAKHEDLGPFIRGLGSFGAVVRKEAGKATPAPYPSRLPGPPPRCFGREDEIRELVETLLQPSPPPTPILGPPGVGKTTVMLEALHEPGVKARWGNRRFFIRCDGAGNRDALLAEISLGLGLESGPDLENRLFQSLEREPTVLALDNLETPWDADTVLVEELLTQLSTARGVTLVASVRGDQRPAGPRWRESIRVGPFGLPAARDTFVDIAGAKFLSDPDLDRLLEAVDRLPIAVVLMAHQAEGEPDLAGLWKLWQEKRTALLRRADGKERLTNIEVSLELSILGPRMTPEAAKLLSVLAQLPDGIERQDIGAVMPSAGEEAAPILRKVGLAFDQGTRLRVLAPIREHVRRQHPSEVNDLERAVEHFLVLAETGDRLGWPGGAEAASRLVQDLGNLDNMILLGLARPNPEPAIRAVVNLGKFLQVTGLGSRAALERAMEVSRASGRARLEAGCLERLGDIALARSDHDDARERYQEALPLYRKVGDVRGEANCIQRLGDIALECFKGDEAHDYYQHALLLYRRLADVLGEANCIRSLGDIALARSEHGAARARYEEALPMFQKAGSLLGEANCIQGLGELAFLNSDTDDACRHYEQAWFLYHKVGSVLGEANCIQSLGDIALARAATKAAFERFHEALSLYQRIPEPYSSGWAHVRLARLAAEGSADRQAHLKAAREAWERLNQPDLLVGLQQEFGIPP